MEIKLFKIFLLVLSVLLPKISFGNNIDLINTNIEKYNQDNVCNLILYNKTLTKDYIINNYIVDNNFKEFQNFSFDVNKLISYNNYKYGVVIRKSNLRFLPTNKQYIKNKNNNFDYLQNSEIKFNEPVIVLFEYNDWYFVQSYNANGWVNKFDIALFKTKKSFQNYINYDKFVIVIDKKIIIDNLYLDMSVKLNYLQENKENYNIKLPKRDQYGFVYFIDKKISKNGLNNRYLEYNEKNLKNQVFKYLDTKYEWGGKNNGIDCSGFVLNVYGTFGIKLPRDSINQQKSTGNYISIPENMNLQNRLDLLKKTKVGSLLYFKGHIMIYLGFIDNKPKIIHSIASYLNNTPMSVKIDDLYIKRINNTTFIQNISSITNF